MFLFIFNNNLDTLIIGLDSNPYCENLAYQRLNQINKITNNNIQLKDYLIGFSQNMSCIRTESIQIVVLTDFLSYVENPSDTLNEIYRILKPVCYFIKLYNNLISIVELV